MFFNNSLLKVFSFNLGILSFFLQPFDCMTSSYNLIFRSVVLFLVGAGFFWVCEALQNVTGNLSSDKLIISSRFLNQLWIPISCGIASGN